MQNEIVSRDLFWSMASWAIVGFYAIGILAIGIFLLGLWRHVRKYKKGAPPAFLPSVWRGLRHALYDLFSHRTLRRRDRSAGIAHAFIFYGFLTLFAGTTFIFIDHDILQPLTGVSLWQGDFYLWFSLALDIAGIALLGGLLFMMGRRGLLRLQKLNYVRHYLGESALRESGRIWRIEDWIFLSLLALIVATGFLQEGLRLAYDDKAPDAAWSPVGNIVALGFNALGYQGETLAAIRSTHWWFHAALSLIFVAAVSWYKAKHMLTSFLSLSVRDSLALRRLAPPASVAQDGEVGGATHLSDLTWKMRLHLDACTKCGRCHEACPAVAIEAPLSPRDLILDLRELADKAAAEAAPLLSGTISSETLWSCRTCGACQEICPVGIEHPSIIVDMRRSLVESGDMPVSLQQTFSRIADTGNSFGAPARSRGGWTQPLDFPIKDIRAERAEWLWFVGDYASFDPRNQIVSQALAKLLRAAGVDFALLYDGERTAGNDVRRAGEEALFQDLMNKNVAAMESAKPFERILTTDPHSLSTLRNEYRATHELPEVMHYTGVLVELLETGRLPVSKPLGRTVTLHDPCHLGRLNKEYEAPRRVLELIGCRIVEMPRNRGNSFCCGAGGGRIWIADPPGKERPSENRIREAVALGRLDYFVTCCPKDLTMFEDARKTSGCEDAFQVRDIAELVAEAVDLQSLSKRDWGILAERLAGAVGLHIGQSVAHAVNEALASPQWAERIANHIVPRLTAKGDPLPDSSAAMQSEPTPAKVEPVSPPPPDPPTHAPNTVVAVKSKPIALAPMRSDWAVAPVTPAALRGYEGPTKTGRRFLVAIKHVAVAGDDISIIENGTRVDPSRLDGTINEWDQTAMEEALAKAEALGGAEVVAVTVGPEAAEESLLKMLAMGADRAVRIWNDDLIEPDPVTIARLLAGIVVKENPDLVLCGAQSSDHAHAATGMALARIAGMPHAAVAVGLEWDGSQSIKVIRELEGAVQHHQRLRMPAVVSVQTGTNQPRYASLRMVKQAKKKPLTLIDAGSDALDHAGHRVRRIYVPERGKARMLQGSASEVAAHILAVLRGKE